MNDFGLLALIAGIITWHIIGLFLCENMLYPKKPKQFVILMILIPTFAFFMIMRVLVEFVGKLNIKKFIERIYE